ncbi:hypothetical protein BRADI_3g29462v3 [Brachypodium distachyon]|uniref:Uncharacterized protein n=1 Tax=Brachypodium distachyon TaxID=15368 RepID=A0A2K2D004_BRADI|nr:hypothetical protein BRADI_3g29462v3 [Brachypodium distachyon]
MWSETNLLCKSAYFPLIWTRFKDVIIRGLLCFSKCPCQMYVELMQNLVRKVLSAVFVRSLSFSFLC